MASYDELLYELGEVPTMIQNASPLLQLILLVGTNTVLFFVFWAWRFPAQSVATN